MYTILLPVLIPIVLGGLIPLINFKSRALRSAYVGAAVLATSALLIYLAVRPEREAVELLRLTDDMSIAMRVDGPSRVFTLLIAILWPLASLYAFEYMEREGHENRFFAYYTMAYGVTAGIALAANLVTLYIFYELLTLVTLPLVLHKMDVESVRAARKYLYYLLTGAALAFIGLIFAMSYQITSNFQWGGVLDVARFAGKEDVLLGVFMLTFLGFGAKAAVFPLDGWLPSASVAPTPVTALLHAVAVVNAGTFAVIRLIYYTFGTEFLYGSWAQSAAIALAAFTVVYGSVRAVREQHIKRRLAYSTVSNLSYILLGASLMTLEGVTGALMHFITHGVMKIALFFCAGAIIIRSGKEYVQDLRGIGREMPFTMAVLTLAGISLIGIPPLPGFISKWSLMTAASGSGLVFGYVGQAALIISALLTAVYMFQMIIPAYFTPLNREEDSAAISDPGLRMKLPLAVLCVMMIVMVFCSTPIINWVGDMARGAY